MHSGIYATNQLVNWMHLTAEMGIVEKLQDKSVVVYVFDNS